MDYPSSKRQEKRDSKKKQSANSVYTAKHVRISAAIAEKHLPKEPQTNKKK